MLLVLSVLFYGGCGNASSESGEEQPEAGKISEEAIEEASTEQLPDWPIGLYIKSGSDKRVLQNQMQAEYAVGKDITVLSAFLTNNPEISGSKFAEVWLSYQNKLPETATYKIGYLLSYGLVSGNHIEQMIKEPSDTEQNREYLETYIYDDVHQSGWYSHLLSSDITEKTVVTSIKLTGGPNVADVKDIAVEAFLYNPEEDSLARGSTTVHIFKK